MQQQEAVAAAARDEPIGAAEAQAIWGGYAGGVL